MPKLKEIPTAERSSDCTYIMQFGHREKLWRILTVLELFKCILNQLKSADKYGNRARTGQSPK